MTGVLIVRGFVLNLPEFLIAAQQGASVAASAAAGDQTVESGIHN
jgi:hypothetical protein